MYVILSTTCALKIVAIYREENYELRSMYNIFFPGLGMPKLCPAVPGGLLR